MSDTNIRKLNKRNIKRIFIIVLSVSIIALIVIIIVYTYLNTPENGA